MTAVTNSAISHARSVQRIARRNNSLSSTGRLLVFVFIFAVSVGIAAAFAVFGAWLVLPFAGLEMLVLYLAFRYFERHADDYEQIEIDGDQVKLERLEAGSLSTAALSRYWARVAVSRDGSRLALRSHGREFEIGRNLSDEQRLELAQALQRRLRRDENHTDSQVRDA
jgi:uncharacterized membrane protein